MNSLEYLAKHSSHILTSHGFTQPKPGKEIQIGSQIYGWNENDDIEVTCADGELTLQMFFAAEDFTISRGYVLSINEGTARLVGYDKLHAMADYVLKIIKDPLPYK